MPRYEGSPVRKGGEDVTEFAVPDPDFDASLPAGASFGTPPAEIAESIDAVASIGLDGTFELSMEDGT